MEERTRFQIQGEIIFTAVLLIIALTYFIQAFSLARSSAQAPIFILIPFLGLIIFQLVKNTKLYLEADNEDPDNSIAEKDNAKRTFLIFITYIILTVMLYFVGIYIAASLYLLLFILFLSKLKKLTAIIAAIVTPVAIYLLFEIGLGLLLYKGIFFES